MLAHHRKRHYTFARPTGINSLEYSGRHGASQIQGVNPLCVFVGKAKRQRHDWYWS
jgi:hypothetical protein